MTLEAGKKKGGRNWTPATAFRRAVVIYREEGLYALWAKFVGELFYRRLFYLERLLAEPSPDVKAALALQIDLLKADEVDDYLAFHDEDPREQIEHRFSLGEICFVARADGGIICANWACEGRKLSEHWIRYVRYALPIAKDEVYLYDSYTKPDYRGLRVAPCLAVWILDYYRERGYRRTTTAIVPENRTNLRARAKSGYRVCGSLGYLRAGLRLHHFHRDASRPPRNAQAQR
ncbi:MAG: GNAT family N-acetyltransferase [Myxococcota bacterium]|nr:GNAT family N-acetyltransferase [Myxococcota bacterium]